MNGKPGDDPAIDILRHNLPVYSPEADALVREIARYLEFRRVQELLDSLRGLSLEALTTELVTKLAALKAEARARGWEVD